MNQTPAARSLDKFFAKFWAVLVTILLILLGFFIFCTIVVALFILLGRLRMLLQSLLPGVMERNLQQLSSAIFNILAIFAGILGGLWAYTRFLMEREFLPPVQFEIYDCICLGYIGQNMVLDIGIHLKNIGSSTLVARWILLDVRYTKEYEPVTYFQDTGRLRFPYSLVEDRLRNLKEAINADLNGDADRLRELKEDLKAEMKGATFLDGKKWDSLKEKVKADRKLLKGNALLVHNAIEKWKARVRKKKNFPEPIEDSGFPVLYYDTFVQAHVDQRYSFVTTLQKMQTSC